MKLPRIVGLSQLADETAMANEEDMYVREAMNVDIDSVGNVSRREGYEMLIAGSGFHSLYSTSRGVLLVCRRGDLGYLDLQGSSFVTLLAMGNTFQTSYTEMNGNLYVSNSGFSCMFRDGILDTAYPIGVPLPTVRPQFDADLSEGALPAGRYGITYSVVSDNGEESGLGETVEIELTSQGSILMSFLTIIPGYSYRVYMTTTNGEELYQAAEFDADRATYNVMENGMGRQPATKHLEPPPYGHIIRAFNSRLLIGSTDFVYFTEAFRPHLHDSAHGFVPIVRAASMIRPVEDGVFIGDARGIHFYKGKDPESWVVEQVSPHKVIYGTDITAPGAHFRGRIAEFDEVAIWLSTVGYQIGLPTGEVISANAGQVKLPAYVLGSTAFITRDGRKQLISPVNSNLLADAGVALDSSIT